MGFMTICDGYAQAAPSDEITIIVPRNVIANMIKSTLPLNLEKADYLKGRLWIHAIDNITIGSDKVAFEMNIQGRNIKLETHLGNQALWMEIGNFNADFDSSFSLRYDASKRVLHVTPHVLQKNSDKKENKIAANLLQLMSLANGVEYPIEIKKLQPVLTQIGSDQFNIDMDITNIYTEKGRVLISGRPKLEKLK
ncbi:hypothetical protein [Desulforapulum autotrophicum]|nr:hypothetical protein [Desulforapulum autotrophicum]